MGKYAQHRKRGRGDAAVVPALIAPVLVPVETGSIAWGFVGADPFVWSIEASVDGATGWAEVTQVLGANRNAGGLDPNGPFFRIIGLDVASDVVTLYSNVVFNP